MTKKAKRITTKIKLFLPALLFCGSTVHAGRAFEDAVWEHIGKSDNHFVALDNQINSLNSANTNLSQSITQISGQINNLNNANASLSQDIAKISQANDTRITSLDSQISSLSMANTNLSRDIAQISKEIETLKTVKTGVHYLGEQYHGGIIFYLDKSGQHGLIASLMDSINEGVQWRNGASGNKVTNAQGDGIGAGETNTRLIISQQTADKQNGKFAALLAANFQVLEDGITPCKTPAESEGVCYGGWYLPSAYELQLLYTASHNNPSLSLVSDFYWSSTEDSVNKAWIQNIATGEMTTEVKSNNNGHVRAINRF